MRFFRKSAAPAPTTNDVSAAAKLRADIDAIERDMADSKRTLTDLEKRAAVAESRAIDAIRAGDDASAKSHLVEHQEIMKKAEAVQADIETLRVMLDEFQQFVKDLPDSSPNDTAV
jgi:phage shock protein A